MKEQEIGKEFTGHIDKDKTTETPGLLPYAHTVGGAVIKPEDEGRIKGNAISAMKQQTEMQFLQIQEQVLLLQKQAQAIRERMIFSERIYKIELRFDPIIGHLYHLYEKKDGSDTLSMVSPEQWGKKLPYQSYLASLRLLADHTWEVVSK